MLKRNNHLLAYLLAFGVLIAQCAIFFTHYEHELSQPDCKCAVCVVANQLAHAVTSSGLTFNLGRYIPLLYHETVVFHTVLVSTVYSIRAPPLSLS